MTRCPAGEYALLSAGGPAAIASIRAWGPAVADFARRHLRLRRPDVLADRQAGAVLRAALLDAFGAPLDDVLISVHADPPHWDLRLHLHGNPVLVEHCLRLLAAAGLADAPSPEDLWAVHDLLEAEALALLPRCPTRAGVKWLLAQPPRLRSWAAELANIASANLGEFCADLLSRAGVVDWYTRPARIVLAGAPNAGKSSLMNALTEQPTSLVAPSPGTTRDWVEAPGESFWFPVLWLDTAGLRASADPLEQAGMERTAEVLATADAIVYVVDVTGAFPVPLLNLPTERPIVFALNKIDQMNSHRCRASMPGEWLPLAVDVSAEQRLGLDLLQARLWERCARTGSDLTAPSPFTPRQVALLQRAVAENAPNLIADLLLR